MCFIKRLPKNGKIPPPEIANRDIPVLKLLTTEINDNRVEYYSPFQTMKYHESWHYYHTSKEKMDVRKNDERISVQRNNSNKFFSVFRGFHSVKSNSNAYYGLKAAMPIYDVFIRMYIPKGSEYYLNDYGEYVSSDIMWL